MRCCGVQHQFHFGNARGKVDFNLPFYHLSGDKIWRLVSVTGKEVTAYIARFQQFQEWVAYGEFDPELFALLMNAEQRNLIRQGLLDHYFPDTKARFLDRKKAKGYFQDVEHTLLEEDPQGYQALVAEADEEARFIRGGVFKKIVARIYSYACAMTGMRVDSLYNISLIDACHIVPFNISGDDTIRNGIALCPNLHRAFDRGIVSIDADYRVLVSSQFAEDTTHPYSLQALKGQRIHLPFGDRYRPDPDKLAWHRERVFRT